VPRGEETLSAPEIRERLAQLEEAARKIVEALTEERLDKAPTEEARTFLRQIRERWEPATRATEWSDEQLMPGALRMRMIHDARAAAVATGEGGPEGEVEIQRLPADWQRCVGDCYWRYRRCVRDCMEGLGSDLDRGWSFPLDGYRWAACEYWCAANGELCVILCILRELV
jgi:hypothetical protein